MTTHLPADVSLYYDGKRRSVSSVRLWYNVTGLKGFHGDVNATYPVGNIDAESEKLLRVSRRCLDESIKVCKPGALFRDIGKVMWVIIPRMHATIVNIGYVSEPVARSDGCSTVRTYTGHGINDLFHCSPNIPHYAKNKATGTMKTGMVWSSLLFLTLWFTTALGFHHRAGMLW